MRIITISEDKTFSCTNVLLINLGIDNLKVKQLFDHLEHEKIKYSKTKIIWNRYISDDDKYESNLVMVCNKEVAIEGYKTFKTLKIGPCLYVNHSCAPSDLHFVYEKIGIHGYENNMSLRRENITVFREESEHLIGVEVFVPLDVRP